MTITQAPEADVQTKVAEVLGPGSGEQLMLTKRSKVKEVESIWWFATARIGEDEVVGTLRPSCIMTHQ